MKPTYHNLLSIPANHFEALPARAQESAQADLLGIFARDSRKLSQTRPYAPGFSCIFSRQAILRRKNSDMFTVIDGRPGQGNLSRPNMGRLYEATETMRRASLAAEVVNFDQVAGTKMARRPSREDDGGAHGAAC